MRVERDVQRHRVVEEHHRVKQSVHERHKEVEGYAAAPPPSPAERVVERVEDVLAKARAQLVKDLEQVEDHVELQHRLVAHGVVRVRHVQLQQDERDGDDDRSAQHAALLVLRKLLAASEVHERAEDAQRQEGHQLQPAIEARDPAEEQQRLEVERHLQEVHDVRALVVVLVVVVAARRGRRGAQPDLAGEEVREGHGDELREPSSRPRFGRRSSRARDDALDCVATAGKPRNRARAEVAGCLISRTTRGGSPS